MALANQTAPATTLPAGPAGTANAPMGFDDDDFCVGPSTYTPRRRTLNIHVWVDCSTTNSVAGRRRPLNPGRTRHKEVRFLWRQFVVRSRRLETCKIQGDLNPADAWTKRKSLTELSKILGLVNAHVGES